MVEEHLLRGSHARPNNCNNRFVFDTRVLKHMHRILKNDEERKKKWLGYLKHPIWGWGANPPFRIVGWYYIEQPDLVW